MKTYIEKIIIKNRAPFKNIEVDFSENDISVLTAINGSGKTTILSHIVDAWYEIARPHFVNEFEQKQNKYYRISSTSFSLNASLPSFVYIRFRTGDTFVDYIDIRNNCTEDEYDNAIRLQEKIPFGVFSTALKNNGYTKTTSSNLNKDLAEQIFNTNLITYFPAYRYESPGYLNEPYKVKLSFTKESGYAGFLNNPIEVVSGLNDLANWMMDIILDMRVNTAIHEQVLFANLNTIITQTLISKNKGNLRFGVGPRNLGGARIQIVSTQNNIQVYPTLFNLSSGESALLCIFAELLRQADNNNDKIQMSNITGIVLIDEVDKHLHIKLQKEVLPRLFRLFPNVQFILSSHSPFLNMGLAETILERSKIIDLDNFGITTDPTTNELYTEVYNMMLGENQKFKESLQKLEQAIAKDTRPLLITEGKTDAKHLIYAKEKLNIVDCDIEFYNIQGDWGDSKLKILLEQLSKVAQSRKIIGMFDRDDSSILRTMEEGDQEFKDYGNNVYGFSIPCPIGREQFTNISIEFYYSDSDIKKVHNGRSLYFDNEVDYLINKSNNTFEIRKLDNKRAERELSKKIFDEPKMCEITDWIHSKAVFADLVANNEEFNSDLDFSNFRLIFDRIKLILTP